MTTEQPQDKQPENPPAPIDPHDAAWYDKHVWLDSLHGYMKVVFVQDTELLNIAKELKPWIASVHQNTMDNILSRYCRDRRLARTLHRQLLSMMRGYLQEWYDAIPTKEGMSIERFNEAKAAIEEAEWVAKYADALAEKERSKQKAGNVEIIKASTS